MELRNQYTNPWNPRFERESEAALMVSTLPFLEIDLHHCLVGCEMCWRGLAPTHYLMPGNGEVVVCVSAQVQAAYQDVTQWLMRRER